jgi:hypothetical protein
MVQMQPGELLRTMAAKNPADILYAQHGPPGRRCNLMAFSKKTVARTASNKQTHREEFYAGGAKFIPYQQWFWNCLPWANKVDWQEGNKRFVSAAEGEDRR